MYAPQSWSEKFDEIIRRNTYAIVAKELLAGKPELHKYFSPDSIGDDGAFAASCRKLGMTDSSLNVIGCARVIVEMAVEFDCPVDESDLPESYKALMLPGDMKGIFPPFVSGMSFAVFVRAWHAVQPYIDDIHDLWMRHLRRDLVNQHRAAGWTAEMMPLVH